MQRNLLLEAIPEDLIINKTEEEKTHIGIATFLLTDELASLASTNKFLKSY